MVEIGPTEVKSMKSRDQELNPGAGTHLRGSDSVIDRREASVYQWKARCCVVYKSPHCLTFHYKIQETVNRRKNMRGYREIRQ